MSKSPKGICIFAGNREVFYPIEDETRAKIRSLIESGYTEFWTGGMGEFDALCARLVREMKREFPQVRLCLIMSAMTETLSRNSREYASRYDEVIVCGASDGAYYKRAVTLRNRWMAEECSCVLAFVQRDYGGAYETVRHAAKKEKLLLFVREKPEVTEKLKRITARK